MVLQVLDHENTTDVGCHLRCHCSPGKDHAEIHFLCLAYLMSMGFPVGRSVILNYDMTTYS